MRIFMFLMILSIALFAQKVVDVSVFHHPPLSYSKEGEKPQGVFIDVLEEVAKKNNWELRFHQDSFANNLQNINSEKTDILIAFADSKERREIYDFCDDTIVSTWIQVFSKPSLKVNTFQDLEGRTIAGIKGYIQFKKFSQSMKSFGFDFKTYEVDTDADAFKAVEEGKADALVTEYFSSLRHLQNTSLLKQALIFYPYGTTYGTKKGTNQEIIQSINRFIKEQKQDPNSKYYQILEKWFGEAYSKKLNENITSPMHKVHKVAVLRNWKPYYYLNKDNKASGYAIELFEKLATNIGLKYEYVFFDTWNEMNEALQNKQIDIIPNTGKALKRANYTDFTQTTDLFEVGLFKHAKIKDIETIKDLKEAKVGIVNKNICSKLITEDMTQNKLVFSNLYSALADLEENKIDVLCYPKKIIVHSIQEMGLKNIEAFERPLMVIDRAIGMQKGNQHLVSLFDSEFLKLKASGEYQSIYNKWFVKDKDIQLNYEELIEILVLFVLVGLSLLYYLKRKNLILTKNELLKKTEQIKKEQRIHKFYLDTMNSLVVVLDTKGNIVMMNRFGLEILGYKEEEIIGKNWFEIGVLPKEQFKMVKEYFEKVMDRKVNLTNDVLENELNDKDGNRLIFNWSNSLIIDNGEIKGIVSSGTNITNEKKQLDIINEQAKLVSMGEMIGNIAHQWRQPLSIISTSASGMKVQSEYGVLKQEDIANFSDLIVQQAEYLSTTIDNFRDFVKGDMVYGIIHLKDALSQTISLVKASLDDNYITLIENIDEDITFRGNTNELSQAFINILNNAKDALKEKVSSEDRYIFIETRYLQNDTIELNIKDTGGGIPKKIIHQIFEPYFTTKHQSQGTGLGLSMAYKIICQRHKGEISVQNEEIEHEGKRYKGASFKIIFKREV